jgi:hypothetical protein
MVKSWYYEVYFMPENEFSPEITLPVETAVQVPRLRSFYFDRAEKRINEQLGSESETGKQIIDVFNAIDTEAEKNIAQFESPSFPGVKFPYTRVHIDPVRSVLEKYISPTDRKDSLSDNVLKNPTRSVYLVLPGSPIPGQENINSLGMGWDMVVDRAFRSLPSHDNKVEEVISVGSPLSPGGEITEEWANKAEENVLEADGKIFADLVTKLDHEYGGKVIIVINGLSFTGSEAEAVANYVSPELQKRLRLLIDNPEGTHSGPLSMLKGVQIMLGFLAETVRGNRSDRKDDWIKEPAYSQTLNQIKKEKGMKVDYSPEEKALREKARKAHVWQIFKGIPFKSADVKTFVRRGLYDPTSMNIQKAIHAIQTSISGAQADVLSHKETGENSRREFAIRRGHAIDRHDIDVWARSVKGGRRILALEKNSN